MRRSVTQPCYEELQAGFGGASRRGGNGEVDRDPSADSKRRGPEPLGVLSAVPAHEELSRLQSGGPHNPLASLSAARFRVEAQLMKGGDRGQGPSGGDPANTEDFPWEVGNLVHWKELPAPVAAVSASAIARPTPASLGPPEKEPGDGHARRRP